MRGKIKEENRWKLISNIVVNCYNEVIKISKSNKNTTFIFSPCKTQHYYNLGGSWDFLDNRREDIIKTLQYIFVGCDI